MLPFFPKVMELGSHMSHIVNLFVHRHHII